MLPREILDASNGDCVVEDCAIKNSLMRSIVNGCFGFVCQTEKLVSPCSYFRQNGNTPNFH